ncbi:hypothetical protein [Xanthomonas sacchari]|uniref:hypothetical protein n=1 Tax=Xanthomonas sacchari TaxID=56458 RepID=UPI00225561C4|nr:hypothetical protein [Xanthomonas sacchari]
MDATTGSADALAATASAFAAAFSAAFAPAFAFAFAFAPAFALALPLTYRVPSARQPRRGKTRRAAHMDVRRSRQGQDAPSANPRRGCGPGARSAEGALRGVLSFGYFSLHKQRKVTRRQAKALLLHLLPGWRPLNRRSGFSRDRQNGLSLSRLKPLLQIFSSDEKASINSSSDSKSFKGFRPCGRVTFLCSRKEKVTKRKRALPRALRAARSGSASSPGIRGRGILPLPRTAHVPVRRPFGVFPRAGRRFGREPGKSKAGATAKAKAKAKARQQQLLPLKLLRLNTYDATLAHVCAPQARHL